MSNEYGHGKERNPRRKLTDEQIKALSESEAYDLMSQCDFEPADPDICDPCAAYVLRT
jgi:hypothetical protein